MASSSDPPQADPPPNTPITIDDLINDIPVLLQFVASARSVIPPLSSDATSNGGGSSSSNHLSDHENQLKLLSEVEILQRDLNAINDALGKLKTFEESLGGQFKFLKDEGKVLDDAVIKVKQSPNVPFAVQQIQAKVRKLSEIVLKLKLQIPSSHKLLKNSEAHRSDTANETAAYNVIDGMPVLHKDDSKLKDTLTFMDLRENYGKLECDEKLCLLCFAVFPENVVFKKRLLLNWWIGEGFVDYPVDGDMTVEDNGHKILNVLEDKNFIERVTKKRNILVGFRMHTLVRSSLIILAKEAGFFDFDSLGIPTEKFSWSCRACLVKTEGHNSRKKLTSSDLDLENLRTIFNVNDPYPDFELDWFSKMRNVNVLHLGAWQSSAKHHIEVEDTAFLRGLKNMKHLKLFSLQGISRISELPDSICKLANLRILDLNKCHNLESLPDKIDLLKKLTHLDISECYLLDHMPKGLASLLELQVLKGFIISDQKGEKPCTLRDLAALKKLRKLIISTSRADFPAVEDMSALRGFPALQKLTIAWGGKSLHEKADNNSKKVNTKGPQLQKKFQRTNAMRRNSESSTSFAKLKKLDLQCFPGTAAPDWLKPSELKNLKKLYIRGGNLSNLSEVDVASTKKWGVEILRLKFLSKLKMHWKELHLSFPKLIYLEKVKCPKLAFFPCDQSGVWQNTTIKSKQS